MHTILLVDDDTFLLDMYTLKFNERGYQVATAKSAEEALKLLRGGATYEAILLDMIMPQMSGLELLKAIKKESLGGAPLCIVLSNQGEKSDIDEANAAGAAGYIIKANVIPSEVVMRVEEYFTNNKK